MDRFQRRRDLRIKKIQEDLSGFPSSFTMEGIDKMTQKAFGSLRNHLEAGLKAGYRTSLETARVRNLLAFALFKLGECSDALEQIDQVLDMEDQQNNLVSLANKAHMFALQYNFDEAGEVVGSLQELKEDSVAFDNLMVLGKAELAASYMHFGGLFNQYAITAFGEVLPKAKEPEVWMWKLGLAVAYRQALTLQCIPYLQREQSAIYKSAMQLLQEVINSKPLPGRQAASDNLKANAYVERALLIYSTWDKNEMSQLCSQAHTSPLASCKEALKLDGRDASVLWKAGKIYRYHKDVAGSMRLLRKAIAVQPSSAAYHHLGLTLKATATNITYGKGKTRRGGKRQKERKRAREEKTKLQGAGSQAVNQPDKHRRAVRLSASARKGDTEEQLKRAVKSPKDATEFDPRNDKVQEAFKYLKEAVDFSCKENSRAIYDLALMHKAANQPKEALTLLNEITSRQNCGISTPAGLLDQVVAFDQQGLIYKDMARVEDNARKKKTLEKKSESRSYSALQMASEYFSKVEQVKDRFGKILHSPSALLQAMANSELSHKDKQTKKAAICNLMNEPQTARALLNEIPMHAQDESVVRGIIDSYVKENKYEKAATELSLLEPSDSRKVRMLFQEQQDVPYPLFEIYFKAGLQALENGSSAAAYFRTAFMEAVDPTENYHLAEQSSAGATTSANWQSQDDSEPPKRSGPLQACQQFDVMLLHDEEEDFIEGKAKRLKEILGTTCGLRVVRRSDNYPLGTDELKTILDNIEQSLLVAVLPGQEEMTDLFRIQHVTCASKRENTVVLLVDGIGDEAIPQELKIKKVMQCPSELLGNDLDLTSQACIDSVGRLFKFLINGV